MNKLSRRTLLSGATLLAASSGVRADSPTGPGPSSLSADDVVSESGKFPLADTQAGQVRGYRRRGLNIFKGIPYAGGPSGAGRFLRAPALTPWSGVRNALSYGALCPQVDSFPTDMAQSEYMFLVQFGPRTAQSEDCLRINIWSPAAPSTRKRPIMLWLHPNGFEAGSGQDYLAADGENLARTHGVVVASINHRLNVFGYLDLREVGGERYADSGNVGMLDIVDALRWLRTNGPAFGGDPDNITIFGESGGGQKVCTLLAMPEAKGLFHRAVVQSGAMLRAHTSESAAELTEAIMTALGLGPKDLAGLLATPAARLVEAYLKVVESRGAKMRAFGPVAGVPTLPAHPFDPQAPDSARDVPLIVMTTLNERSPSVESPEIENIGWDELPAQLRKYLAEVVSQGDKSNKADKADQLIAAVRKTYPNAHPADVLSIALSSEARVTATTLCERRAAQGGAAVYSALFAWHTALLDGRPRAYHTSDIAFVFGNTDLVDQQTGGGSRARALGKMMSAAWAQFARTGNPNGPGIAVWPAYDLGRRTTMVFDDKSVACADLDPAIRAALT